MKKLYLIVSLLMFSFVLNAATITEEKTASALIYVGEGEVAGITIITDGTNAVTMTLYDNTAASGKKLTPDMIISTAATNRTHFIEYRKGECTFETGLYIATSTDGTVTYIVSYEKR